MITFHLLHRTFFQSFVTCIICFCSVFGKAQDKQTPFNVIAFYTAKQDQAHISFVHQANSWFPKVSGQNNFKYDSTDNWSKLNPEFLSHYQVVLFLDTRPEDPVQREAFKTYMNNGGAWMGFHFAGFALTPSEFPKNSL